MLIYTVGGGVLFGDCVCVCVCSGALGQLTIGGLGHVYSNLQRYHDDMHATAANHDHSIPETGRSTCLLDNTYIFKNPLPGDDGNIQDGDGCSSSCKVESGYECTMTSPSLCWRHGDTPPPGPAPSPSEPDDDPHTRSDDSKSDSKSGQSGSHGAVFGVVIAFAIVAAAATTAYVQRDAIYARYPGVEDAIDGIKDRFEGTLHRLGVRSRYAYSGDLNIDEADMASPDFTHSMPPPGGRGPYAPLSGRAPSNA